MCVSIRVKMSAILYSQDWFIDSSIMLLIIEESNDNFKMFLILVKLFSVLLVR